MTDLPDLTPLSVGELKRMLEKLDDNASVYFLYRKNIFSSKGKDFYYEVGMSSMNGRGDLLLIGITDPIIERD